MKLHKPEISARKNKFAIKFFDFAFKRLLEKNFYAVRVKNKHNFYLRDENYSNILYGTHSCWWDGILATFIFRNLYNCNFHMMIKDLYRFTSLAYAGGFSVEKHAFRGSLTAVNYSIKLLENPAHSLWIFPQGNIMPSNSIPIKFESGIAHICKKLDGVNLIPIVYQYLFLRKEKPEILVEIGKPIIVKGGINDKNEFLLFIQGEFEKLLEAQKAELAKGQYDGYECVLHNDQTWLRMMETNFKPLLRAKF
ncbi:MAG: hypothetical protein A2Y25_00935 [Candidatus Melainabacteria bacterium GWF2_37_15]|nr:MAG: hypothetical protein A2Y25_00935 [Candidatus Melainabacteria bacterium GWF2_37_15]